MKLTTFKKLSEAELKLMVVEAIDLDRTIREEVERLKEMKTTLIEQAFLRDEAAVETDGGGWSVTLTGHDGSIARVTHPAAKLKSSIEAESKVWLEIKGLLATFSQSTFKATISYAPVENFREVTAALLEKTAHKKLLKLMTSKSATTVSFETKEPA